MPEPALPAEDERLRRLLRRVKTIAVVGLSANPARPSYEVASRFCSSRGYRVTGVNPALAGRTLFGRLASAR